MPARHRARGALGNVVEALDAAVEQQAAPRGAELQLHPAARAVAAGREIPESDAVERLPSELHRQGPTRGDALLSHLDASQVPERGQSAEAAEESRKRAQHALDIDVERHQRQRCPRQQKTGARADIVAEERINGITMLAHELGNRLWIGAKHAAACCRTVATNRRRKLSVAASWTRW